MFTIIDLTQALSAESRSYPGDVPAWTAERIDLSSPVATVTRFSGFDPHGGTHMDAPLHFAPEGVDIAALPLRLYPTVVVSIDGLRVEADSIPTDCAGRAVLFSTGWEDRAGTPGYYEGFPSITGDAAQLLVDRGVGLVGVDSPIVEGLVNLRALLSVKGEVLFAAFALKLSGLEGSPVRAVALVRG